MIEVSDLRKEFGAIVAVDGVSFTARPGAIFGLLGPNGAGKSTTIGCISGLLPPTAGRVRVMGHDVAADGVGARAALGIVPQELALYEDLSAAENLEFWGGAYGLSGAGLRRRVAEVLDRVGLADRARAAVKTCSGGMKRRLNFACGVVHQPKVLLLDEPTVGVDPQSRVRILDLVREEVRAGACVLYTTHYMEEAQELCDELAIIDHGRIIAQGTIEDLRRMMGERDLVRLAGTFDPAATRRALERLPETEVVTGEPHLFIVATPGAPRALPVIFTVLGESGAEVREATLTQPGLETLFIKLTGREMRE